MRVTVLLRWPEEWDENRKKGGAKETQAGKSLGKWRVIGGQSR